jgi:hypothetical protein
VFTQLVHLILPLTLHRDLIAQYSSPAYPQKLLPELRSETLQMWRIAQKTSERFGVVQSSWVEDVGTVHEEGCEVAEEGEEGLAGYEVNGSLGHPSDERDRFG